MTGSRRLLRSGATLALLLGFLPAEARAGTFTVQWDPSDAPDLAGYIVYHGPKSGTYENSIDVGNATSWTLEGLSTGRHYFVAVRAYNTAGLRSDLSEEVNIYVPVYPGPPVRPGFVVGLERPGAGWLPVHGGQDRSFQVLQWLRLPWPGYSASGGEVRPALGDLDGDGRHELVLGPGVGGGGWLAVLDDEEAGHALLAWLRVPWPEYQGSNGSLYPAVGDVDGDGRAEIVVGLGSQDGAGWFAIFDDAQAGFEFLGWRRVSWPAYNQTNGETRPAVGDLNGDGRAEIVIGLGPGGGGWLQVFGGAPHFQPLRWLRVQWPAYNAQDGATWPAVGDLDGDGRGEMVVGLGQSGAGWLQIFDDALADHLPLRWIRIGWPAYHQANGETRPAIGNLDGTAGTRIVIGLGTMPNHGGWLQIRGNASSDYAPVSWQRIGWPSYEATGAGTFPAVGRVSANP
jgi:hypothetical protein